MAMCSIHASPFVLPNARATIPDSKCKKDRAMKAILTAMLLLQIGEGPTPPPSSSAILESEETRWLPIR
jgi:hypothetical protein